MQKRIVRAIFGADYNAHAAPLFDELRIFNLNNLYKYEVTKFMYNYEHS